MAHASRSISHMRDNDYENTLFPSQRCVVGFIERPKIKRNTKRVGIVSELVAMERFAAAGFRLLLPFGENSPYDLVLENRKGRLFRVQVKTGRLRRGVVLFNCVSNHGHRKSPRTRYVGMIDAFAIYCPDNHEFYVIRIDAPAVTTSYGSLRIAAAANNMQKTIHWARDYRFDESNPDRLLDCAASERIENGAAGED